MINNNKNNSSSNEVLLRAANLYKVFREGRETVEVLRGVSLELRKGEVVALEGPSGSGKSTLLCILGCLLSPTSGRLSIGGEHVCPGGVDATRIRRDALGFVFQQFNLVSALTALENVAYPLRLKGCGRRDARTRATEALGAVGLLDRLHFLPRDLSGGQKQRVAIARAIAGDPHVILADEPTANLDAAAAANVLSILTRLTHEAGRALLIVTHDPKVRPLADRVLRLEDGVLRSVSLVAAASSKSADADVGACRAKGCEGAPAISGWCIACVLGEAFSTEQGFLMKEGGCLP